jgi:hypothetical protein
MKEKTIYVTVQPDRTAKDAAYDVIAGAFAAKRAKGLEVEPTDADRAKARQFKIVGTPTIMHVWYNGMQIRETEFKVRIRSSDSLMGEYESALKVIE